MSVKAVIFDIDGTLVDSELVHHKALLDALNIWRLSPPETLQLQLIGLSMRDTYTVLSKLFNNVPNYNEFVSAKLRCYISRSAEIKMREGAEAAYRMLQLRSVSRALVSNADRIIVETNIRAAGLFEPGLVSVSRNDVRRGKPDPEPYLRAAHLLDVEPVECLVIEDSPLGAQAGLAAGMMVAAWPEPERTNLMFPSGVFLLQPHELITQLAEILDVNRPRVQTPVGVAAAPSQVG